MKWYAIGKTLTPLDRAPESGAAVVLLAVNLLERRQKQGGKRA